MRRKKVRKKDLWYFANLIIINLYFEIRNFGNSSVDTSDSFLIDSESIFQPRVHQIFLQDMDLSCPKKSIVIFWQDDVHSVVHEWFSVDHSSS